MKLEWEGEISYWGQRIPSSNIVDLMVDTMRQKTRKSHPQQAGLQEFGQALKEKTNIFILQIKNNNETLGCIKICI